MKLETILEVEQLQKEAEDLTKKRLILLVKVSELLSNNHEIVEEITKFDKSFVRKLRQYIGDITTHRVAKVLMQYCATTDHFKRKEIVNRQTTQETKDLLGDLL